MTRSRSFYLKDPDAVLDYTFDWGPWLPEGDQLVDHEVVVSPVEPGGVTVDASQLSTGSSAVLRYVIVWLSGGNAGTSYQVTCRVTTADGRTDDRTMTIQVAER